MEEILNKSEGPWGQRQVALTVFSEFILSVTTPLPPSKIQYYGLRFVIHGEWIGAVKSVVKMWINC
jgi:hypothetical protein